jgi:DNA-binding HxlR family transcriptional regulator
VPRDAAPAPTAVPADPLDLGAEFLAFFKALADESRLRIIGRLAGRPHTVEELAEALGLRASTVSHHLAKLAEVGLVSARAESYYNVYRLELRELAQRAGAVVAKARRAPAALEVEGPAFDRKVVRTYFTPEGQLKALPTQAKKRLAVLRHVLAPFAPGRRYSEKQVNEILTRFSREEYVTLRRYLIDYRLMEREGGGGEYWRVS